MNQIPTRQNEPEQIQRLAAQRESYSEAKRLQVWQLIITVLASVGLSIWALIDPTKSDWAAIGGGLFAVIDVLLFEQLISGYREKAAKIQELFDCHVLELECSSLHDPKDITDHEIATYYNKHKRTLGNLEELVNWYSPKVGVLPIHLGRLVCQLSNCSWDSELRRRYANLAAKVLTVTVIVLVLAGLVLQESFKDFLLLGFALSPLLIYSFRQYKDQREASKRQKELVMYAQSLWEKGFIKTAEKLTQQSRQLQNAIYDARSKNPIILDKFYKRLKGEQEETMNRTVDSLTEEAQQRQAETTNHS